MATIFFSYSHKDETLRDEFEVHLAMLKREGAIELWHDRKIPAGNELDGTISQYLEKADVILLFVSPDFLASKYCYDVEVKRGMERHREGTARVIPIILRPCDWQKAPFAALVAAPKDGKAVTKWANQDEAFLDVVQRIRAALPEKLHAPHTPSKTVAQPAPVRSELRSSNLRIKKEFSEADKDRFLDDAFEFMADFFENSLEELQKRNAGIEARFKRQSAQAFSAVIYKGGSAAAKCGIRNGTSGGMRNSITFSYDDTSPHGSFNESMSVEVGDQALSLKPMGMSMRSRVRDEHLTMEGASEYYWEMLIGRMQ
jgi:hypothetical protein